MPLRMLHYLVLSFFLISDANENSLSPLAKNLIATLSSSGIPVSWLEDWEVDLALLVSHDFNSICFNILYFHHVEPAEHFFFILLHFGASDVFPAFLGVTRTLFLKEHAQWKSGDTAKVMRRDGHEKMRQHEDETWIGSGCKDFLFPCFSRKKTHSWEIDVWIMKIPENTWTCCFDNRFIWFEFKQSTNQLLFISRVFLFLYLRIRSIRLMSNSEIPKPFQGRTPPTQKPMEESQWCFFCCPPLCHGPWREEEQMQWKHFLESKLVVASGFTNLPWLSFGICRKPCGCGSGISSFSLSPRKLTKARLNSRMMMSIGSMADAKSHVHLQPLEESRVGSFGEGLVVGCGQYDKPEKIWEVFFKCPPSFLFSMCLSNS